MTRQLHPWEASYPESVRWDAPIRTSTIPAFLDRIVKEYAGRPALEFRGRRMTYAELGERADRLARGLLARGVLPGDAVALLLGNSPAHPIAFFATLRAGARVVHLSPLDPVRAMERKLQDSGARTLIVGNLPSLLPQALAARQSGAVGTLIVAEDLDWGAGVVVAGVPPGARTLRDLDGPDAEWPAVEPADVAVLQYTGGTTGAPRAAMLTHANLTAAVAMYDAWTGDTERAYSPGDKVLVVLPLFHIYALTAVMLRALWSGVELMLRARFDVNQALDDIEKGRCTHFYGVPTMWIAMANHPDITTRDLSSLKVTSSGGAALPHEVGVRMEGITGLRLGGGWGMTETSPAGTNLPLDRAPGPGDIGLPLPGIEMDVVALDDPARVLPPGETGENPHPRAERDARLLAAPGGNGGGLRGRLVPHRRHRAHGAGRHVHPGGPQEGHDHLRRLQRVPPHGRGRDPRAPERAGSRGDRRAGPVSRPIGQGLCRPARRGRAADA